MPFGRFCSLDSIVLYYKKKVRERKSVMAYIRNVRLKLVHHSLREKIGRVIRKALAYVYVSETYVWYELILNDARPRISLPSGFRLVQGSYQELPLLDQVPTMPTIEKATWQLQNAADLWLVLEGQQLAFACWIFRGAMPMRVAPRRQVVVSPPSIVCLENSATSPAYRGRGLAPAAWSGIADELEPRGIKFIVTKIEVSNVASQRAVKKSGFRESATLRYRRIVRYRRATVQAETDATVNWDWLAEQFSPSSRFVKLLDE
jgi:ribosomal protein S18 acetylase RimI-like enzyme